jgi:hypothetical protein
MRTPKGRPLVNLVSSPQECDQTSNRCKMLQIPYVCTRVQQIWSALQDIFEEIPPIFVRPSTVHITDIRLDFSRIIGELRAIHFADELPPPRYYSGLLSEAIPCQLHAHR